MFILFPLLLIVASLTAIGSIIYRKIPRDLTQWNEALSQENFGPTFYQKALAKTSFKSQQIFLSFSTKFFHKVRLASLKTDNFSGKLLQKIHAYKKEFQQENNQPQEIIALTEAKDEAIKKVEDSFKERFQNSTNEDEGIVKIKKIVVVRQPAEAKALPEKQPQKIERPFEFKEQQLINQLTYNPKDVSIYKKLGWLYLNANKSHQAKQAFQTAIKLGSRDRIILAKLAEMEEKFKLNIPPSTSDNKVKTYRRRIRASMKF